MEKLTRCAWVSNEEIYQNYHDTEWGIPIHNDQALFENLVLEGMQAGLSWITVLRKREHFRSAFDYFDPQLVAQYNEDKVNELVQNANLIRHRGKIQAAINNAQQFLKVQIEFGSFDQYIWSFVNYAPIVTHWESEIPAKTALSDLISKDLKKRGFKFVGSLTIYAYMQACGLVCDHTQACFKSQHSSI